MQKFTPDALRDYLDERKGATFIGLYANSAPQMNKTGNPYFGNVVHQWGRNVTFGANYANSVNRRWDEVGHDEFFIAEQLWRGHGERINAYMARHKEKGSEYLVYQLRTDAEGKTYKPLHDVYRLADTGEVIDIEKLRPWMPVRKPSKAQMVEVLGCRETFPRTVHIDEGILGKFRLGVQTLNCDNDQFVVTV